MATEFDLLPLSDATITAPAGCGKTELIADALRRYRGEKPILVLTHTNAGVAALRARLEKGSVPNSSYRISTIDGWSIRLATIFPMRSGLDPSALTGSRPDYLNIREATIRLLSGGQISDVLRANYQKMIVDEYQDCTQSQHRLICSAANELPTILLGDPLQAIFNWRGNEPPDWVNDVCERFPVAKELGTPWRWKNAGTEALGRWLLEIRPRLVAGSTIDLRTAPKELEWIHLDGSNDDKKRREAARTPPSSRDEKVLVIGNNMPSYHRHIASQTPGAITVEAVDLRDLVDFAGRINFASRDALAQVLSFAGSLITNVGEADILRRVEILRNGRARTSATELEQSALNFLEMPGPLSTLSLLAAIGAAPGTRVYRSGVLRAAVRALGQCHGSPGNSFGETAIRVREQSRLVGRPLAARSVGGPLLLKGLEADTAVVLCADELNATNLYVALTRGCKKVVVCSRSPVLRPSTN